MKLQVSLAPCYPTCLKTHRFNVGLFCYKPTLRDFTYSFKYRTPRKGAKAVRKKPLEVRKILKGTSVAISVAYLEIQENLREGKISAGTSSHSRHAERDKETKGCIQTL